MADDPTQEAAAAAPAPPPTAYPAPSPTPYLQLTQSRVPLDQAGEAFTVPDESGRLPIVILPKQPFRIRNELVIVGVITVLIGFFLDLQLALRGGLVVIGVVLIFLGVFQSFLVAVPEGAQAMLLKSGRYYRTVGAGRHVVPPWILVSHVVTVREIPFAVQALEVPTQDDVRVDLDLLMTFTIGAPEKFVFAISAPDFDQVCQAACLDGIRGLVRSKRFDEVLDLGAADTDQLRETIGADIAAYGSVVQRVVITHIQPPRSFMASREGRRLAAVQRDEQTERHALEERLLADREALERQRITAQRERIQLEAANEALRLQFLEERLIANPHAARHDVDEQRMTVARALATNTRAMVQVGTGGDVADALLIRTLADDPPAPPTPRTMPPATSKARTTKAG